MQLREGILPGVKCTNKINRKRTVPIHRNICKRKAAAVTLGIVTAVCVLAGCGSKAPDDSYQIYTSSAKAGLIAPVDAAPASSLFATDLCVGGTENSDDTARAVDTAETAGVFDLTRQKINFAKNLYERRHPASTTKILTAYLALKYGDPDDIVTVSSTAAAIPSDSSVCGLKVGDRISLKNLLYGLMICSGNDAANAIAEHISGSTSAFAELMNEEAKKLGATTSHFLNAHGYPEDNHYTTAYDLYLIFSAAIRDETFKEIISHGTVDVTYENAAGEPVNAKWENTDWFMTGAASLPSGFTPLGGKTGSADSSGYCLVLYSERDDGTELLSVILKSVEKPALYQGMRQMLDAYGKE